METIVLRATGCTRFPRFRSVQSPTNILFATEECTGCSEHATKWNAFMHKRALSPRFSPSGRQPLAPLPTCRPGMCRARLGDFRRPRIRASTALFSLSLSLPSSAPGSLMQVALDAARQGEEAASCRVAFPFVGSPRDRDSRSCTASSKRPSIDGPRCTRGRAATRRVRREYLSSLRNFDHPLRQKTAASAAESAQIRYSSSKGLFIVFLSFFLPFPLFLSPLLLQANVTKSAAANALRSGLPLENREEELLPRGESIPRCLWWSKGDCRNERRMASGENGREGCHEERGWMAL